MKNTIWYAIDDDNTTHLVVKTEDDWIQSSICDKREFNEDEDELSEYPSSELPFCPHCVERLGKFVDEIEARCSRLKSTYQTICAIEYERECAKESQKRIEKAKKTFPRRKKSKQEEQKDLNS